MRTTIIAAFTTTFALTACGGGEAPPPQAPPAPPPATASAAPEPTPTTAPPPPAKPALSELIPQTLKGIGEAFNAHDAAKLASYYTDDTTAVDYGMPELHGKAALQQQMQQLFGAFADAKSSPDRVWIKGNVAIVE